MSHLLLIPKISKWPVSFTSLLFSFSLVFHIFNDTEIYSGIKLFHIPAIVAFFYTIIKFRGRDPVKRVVYVFVFSTFLGSAFSPNISALSSALTFAIVIISSLGISYVDKRKLVITANFIIPIALFFLVRFYYSNVFYRFSGYYNDPNYLCTTLIVFLYLILLGFRYAKYRIAQFLLIVETLFIVLLVGFTVSRTGAICVAILIVGAFWDFLKTHSKYAFAVIAILSFWVFYTQPTEISTIESSYERRADNNDTFSGASSYRWKLSKNGLIYIVDHPQYILLGIGSGSTAHSSRIPDYPQSEHGDHNSWTSCLTEHGLIGFFCFANLMLTIVEKLRRERKRKGRYDFVKIFAFGSAIIFSFSISMMLYLPFWWLIFFISNQTNDETTETFPG